MEVSEQSQEIERSCICVLGAKKGYWFASVYTKMLAWQHHLAQKGYFGT